MNKISRGLTFSVLNKILVTFIGRTIQATPTFEIFLSVGFSTYETRVSLEDSMKNDFCTKQIETPVERKAINHDFSFPKLFEHVIVYK